jgi:cell division transport system permease protein
MALKVDYFLKEAGTNLRRNLTLTVGTLITAAVSVFFVGFAVLIARAVDNATVQWKGGVELIVFMQPEATDDEIGSIDAALKGSPQVDQERTRFLTKAESYDEYLRLYPDVPESQRLTLEQMPTQFKVVLVDPQPDVIDAFGRQFEDRPGVFSVRYAQQAVRAFSELMNVVRSGIFFVAALALVATVLLTFNTIRTAIFARRREIEVMKLVGATNWFIRVPFVLEGVVQGLVSGVVAWGGLWGMYRLWSARIQPDGTLELLASLTVSAAEVRNAGVLIVVLAVLVSAIGSGIAVTRFLDV